VRPSPEDATPRLIPLNKAADDAIQTLKNSPYMRNTGLQFDNSQLEYFKINKEMTKFYNDWWERREQLKTSNIVKLSEEQVQKIVDDPVNAVKLSENAAIKKTEKGKRVEELALKNAITPAEISALERKAEQDATTLFKDRPEITPDSTEFKLARAFNINKLLKERCK